ncbi:hypothetical protein DS901_00670 [Loktanella sp. D2R18]|uniref:Hint domain-containing protein n=1 Tax=Rhodobacterales TaxID=204455 RepID=UPI000DE97A1D|nr:MULTISPECIES: Hint domain-containing protein [Rhodobacterales]MDO6591309.1 Hint domain-containing protein [Yoonia sp. 1_MG-2023]RBW46261.1 hypothetical protein DS901_00670 [Loktanella sp. D2R18]
MATTSFAVLGADVIQGGNINTNSSGGNNNAGTVSFQNGSSIFDADDLVVFEVTNPTADGEIGNGSAISDLTIFDSYADYQAYLASVATGTPDASLIKYNYAPQNPGQTANVQSDISGLGDSYVRFNANVLIPSDGGPTLSNTLTIAPGTNIGANGGATVTIDRERDFDLNYNSSIDGGTIEEGNSNFYIGDYVEIINGGPVCFVAGTYISTADGEKLIETLEVGDMVLTADHGYQPIRWIGRKRFPALGNSAPVQFAPGAIGNSCHLELSPNHRVMVTGWRAELLFGEPEILVPAKFLVNDTTIRYRKSGFVDYVHILFEAHEIVITDNVCSESLLPSWEALTDGTDMGQAELFSLFPESFATQPMPHVLARRSLRNFEAQVFASDASAKR